MELTAVLEALRALKEPCDVVLFSDSRYLKDGMTLWLHTWKQKGWTTSNKQPVKNRDLWEALDEAVHKHIVQWNWVKGHEGHPENERCDKLARKAIEEGPYRSP